MKIDQKLMIAFIGITLLVVAVDNFAIIKNVNIFIVTAFSVIFAAGAAIFISRSISGPIARLKDAADEISKGKLDIKIGLKSKGEIGDLAVSFSRMIEELRRSKNEILLSKAYTDSIIANMVDTLIVVTPEGDIKSVNKATLDLLGYAEEELIGRPVGMIFAEEEEVLFKGKRLRKLIDEGSVRDFEMTYKTKSGEKIPVSFSGSVMYENTAYSVERIADSEEKINAKIIGIVGIARDMRHIKALMADLEGTKAVVEDYARTLEKKVEERTRTLEESQEAALNIMEDMQESKEELEKKTIELEKAKAELETFSKGLEEKVEDRTMELSILYEVSNTISYTLDYQALLKLIMESLFKIVDYDICASLLFDSKTANVTIKPAYSGSAGFVNDIKNSLINSTSTLTGENIRKKQQSVFLIPSAPDAKPKEERKFDKLRSFFNIPFVVRGKTIGMINVSSCKESSFSENDIKLIYTIANQASNAIEHLQSVITAEKSKMESMVESMAEGVIMIDEREEITVFNPRAKEILGVGLNEEITSKQITERMNTIGLYDTFQECRNKPALITKEIIVSVSAREMVLHCDIAPVKNIENNVIGFVIVLRDITREKEVDNMKTEFISTVSHELRTPLATMKEFTSIIADEIPGKLTKDQKEYVDIIKGNIDRLARLINNLLDISKIEAGKAEIKKVFINIADIISTIISTMRPEAAEKQIEIEGVFKKTVSTLHADPDKIIQIFTNLIGNAIKFTPPKGKISVEVKDGKKEIECSVTDTGIGISADNIKRVFGKFQQFGRVPGAGAKGTGLGLAITQQLVQMHNGKILVKSQLGKGSKFTFTLPTYTAGSLFKDYINNSIEEAMAQGTKTALIIVSLINFDKLKQTLIPKKVDAILEDMVRVLKDNMRQVRTDAVVRGVNEVGVVLGGCDREDALKVEGRAEHIIEAYLDEKNLKNKIKIRFGCAVYPDEAENGDELIKAARKM
ncbi:MAG: ATP-binding protein [Candidatus Omnitrophota bacterium]